LSRAESGRDAAVSEIAEETAGYRKNRFSIDAFESARQSAPDRLAVAAISPAAAEPSVVDYLGHRGENCVFCNAIPCDRADPTAVSSIEESARP